MEPSKTSGGLTLRIGPGVGDEGAGVEGAGAVDCNA